MLVFPKNVHGQTYLKGGASIKTDISSGNLTPVEDISSVIVISGADAGLPAFTVDSLGNPAYFSTYDEAKEYYGSGDLAELINTIFNPAQAGDIISRGARRVFGYRVGVPTQASLVLDQPDASDGITVSSRDYGVNVNDIEVKVVKPTADDHVISIRQGTLLETSPSLGKLFVLYYTGTETTATVTITRDVNGKATTIAVSGNATDAISVDLTKYITLHDLVMYLNSLEKYTAVMTTSADSALLTSLLDAETATDLLSFPIDEIPTAVVTDKITFVTDAEVTGVTAGMFVRETPATAWKQITLVDGKDVYANGIVAIASPTLTAEINNGVTTTSLLPAVTDWINTNSSLISASYLETDRDGTGLVAVAFKRLDSGVAGTNPTPTVTDWANAQDDIQEKFKKPALLLVNTSDVTVINSFIAFATEQRIDHNIVMPIWTGADWGTSKAGVLANLQALDSKDCRYVSRGAVLEDINGVQQNRGGIFVAGIGCGLEAGSGLLEPITGTKIKATALEADYSDAEINEVIKAGGIISDTRKDGGFHFQIVVTTSKSSNRFDNMVFLQTQLNTLEMDVIREVERRFFGKPANRYTGNGIVTTVAQILESRIGEDGFLIEGQDSSGAKVKPYSDIQVRFTGTGMAIISYKTNHVDEVDFINITGKASIATFTVTDVQL